MTRLLLALLLFASAAHAANPCPPPFDAVRGSREGQLCSEQMVCCPQWPDCVAHHCAAASAGTTVPVTTPTTTPPAPPTTVPTTTPTTVPGGCIPEGKQCDDDTPGRQCCQPPAAPYRLRCPPIGEETGRHCRVAGTATTVPAVTSTTRPPSATTTVRPPTPTTTLPGVPCNGVGKLCGLNHDPCCTRLCVKHHCAAGTTVTTIPGTPTTTLPPAVSSSAVRFDACALGLSYPNPDERKFDPRTGKPGNEYLAAVRVEQSIFQWTPRVMRALRDIPSCRGKFTSAAIGAENEIPGRLLFKYALQRWQPGGSYAYTQAQYNWEGPQKLFRTLRDCVLADPVANFDRPELTGDLLQLLHMEKASGILLGIDVTCDIRPHQAGTYSYAGMITAGNPGPPLTGGQCQRLAEARAAHHAHAAALLRHDPTTAANLAPNVGETQLAFEKSASTIGQRTLFALIFTGDTDPTRNQDDVDRLTMDTMTAYDEWANSFRCGSGLPPDGVGVVNGRYKHARAHYLRAVAGVSLTTICNRTDILACPATDQ